MQDNYITLVSLLPQEGILDYFDITDASTTREGLSIYLEEKNTPPEGYRSDQFQSKGFHAEIRVEDFPIRGKKAYLCIKPNYATKADLHKNSRCVGFTR